MQNKSLLGDENCTFEKLIFKNRSLCCFGHQTGRYYEVKVIKFQKNIKDFFGGAEL